MKHFVDAIQASVESKNWTSALFLALAMPDICGALETPQRAVGERYRDWFNRYLKKRYDPANLLELTENSGSRRGRPLDPEMQRILASRPVDPATTLSADDCYRLRCKCLHEGLPERLRGKRIHFTVPHDSGLIEIHCSSLDGVLQLSVDLFCLDMALAVGRWDEDTAGDAATVARKAELVQMYTLDQVGLNIVIS